MVSLQLVIEVPWLLFRRWKDQHPSEVICHGFLFQLYTLEGDSPGGGAIVRIPSMSPRDHVTSCIDGAAFVASIVRHLVQTCPADAHGADRPVSFTHQRRRDGDADNRDSSRCRHQPVRGITLKAYAANNPHTNNPTRLRVEPRPFLLLLSVEAYH